MTPDAAMTAVEAKLATDWASGPNTTVAWPNIPFTPPATASWLKVDWIWGNATEADKDGRHVATGILQLAVFAPKDTGDGAIDSTAQTARAIFNGLRMASPNQDVVFGAASGPVRRNEESWRSVVVSIPVQVYESV